MKFLKSNTELSEVFVGGLETSSIFCTLEKSNLWKESKIVESTTLRVFSTHLLNDTQPILAMFFLKNKKDNHERLLNHL